MSILNTKQRNKLPKTEFAIPSKRKYPMENASHARNALARVSQFGTPTEMAQVRRAVHAKYPNMGKMMSKK